MNMREAKPAASMHSDRSCGKHNITVLLVCSVENSAFVAISNVAEIERITVEMDVKKRKKVE